MRPGEWHVTAELRGAVVLRGTAAAVLSNRDLDNLEIRLAAPFPITGFVQRNPSPNRKPTRVMLVPEGIGPPPVAVHEPDGTLRIPDVYPGRYQIRPYGQAEGEYVDAVLLGDRNVTGQTLDLMNGSIPIRVIYKSNGGRVRGHVERGAGGTVVLLSQDESFVNLQVNQALCDPGGAFDIANLRPGSYFAFAFDRIGDHQALSDVDFVRAIAVRGKSVQVEAEHTTLLDDLRIAPWPEQ